MVRPTNKVPTLIAKPTQFPFDPAFHKNMQQGKFIEGNEERFLSKWIESFLSIAVGATIILAIVGSCVFFFINPMITTIMMLCLFIGVLGID